MSCSAQACSTWRGRIFFLLREETAVWSAALATRFSRRISASSSSERIAPAFSIESAAVACSNASQMDPFAPMRIIEFRNRFVSATGALRRISVVYASPTVTRRELGSIPKASIRYFSSVSASVAHGGRSGASTHSTDSKNVSCGQLCPMLRSSRWTCRRWRACCAASNLERISL